MGKKFVTQKELSFIERVNRELIQRVVGEDVRYYEFLPEQSQKNDLYGESIRKTWAPPVEINALVLWDSPGVSFTKMTADTKYTLEVYFHTQELIDRDVSPKEGDFVECAGVFFEIMSVNQPQIVFGHLDQRIMTKCMCTPSREGQFQAGADSSMWIDSRQ